MTAVVVLKVVMMVIAMVVTAAAFLGLETMMRWSSCSAAGGHTHDSLDLAWPMESMWGL